MQVRECVRIMKNQHSDVFTDIDNVELSLPITHTKEELEEKLDD